MLDIFFKGLFDTDLTAVISVTDFLLCLGASLVIGLLMTFAYMYRTRYTKSFVITLALLPAVVCVVIMMVNGNVGTGVAVAGAFSLVRFRSVPGTAKEICALFLAMGAGLISGMGYIGYALLFTVIMSFMFVIYNCLNFRTKKNSEIFKTFSNVLKLNATVTSRRNSRKGIENIVDSGNVERDFSQFFALVHSVICGKQTVVNDVFGVVITAVIASESDNFLTCDTL